MTIYVNILFIVPMCIFFVRKITTNKHAILSNREVSPREIVDVSGDNKLAIVLIASMGI